jgi:hypothetical protein
LLDPSRQDFQVAAQNSEKGQKEKPVDFEARVLFSPEILDNTPSTNVDFHSVSTFFATPRPRCRDFSEAMTIVPATPRPKRKISTPKRRS